MSEDLLRRLLVGDDGVDVAAPEGSYEGLRLLFPAGDPDAEAYVREIAERHEEVHLILR
jgi:hypothetical protein